MKNNSERSQIYGRRFFTKIQIFPSSDVSTASFPVQPSSSVLTTVHSREIELDLPLLIIRIKNDLQLTLVIFENGKCVSFDEDQLGI